MNKGEWKSAAKKKIEIESCQRMVGLGRLVQFKGLRVNETTKQKNLSQMSAFAGCWNIHHDDWRGKQPNNYDDLFFAF